MSPGSYNFILKFVAYDCGNSLDGDRRSPGHPDGTARRHWEVEAGTGTGKGEKRWPMYTATSYTSVGMFKGVIYVIGHPCAPLPLPHANEN